MVKLGKNDYWHVIKLSDFINKQYEIDSCVEGDENYTWLDVAGLIMFGAWTLNKMT